MTITTMDGLVAALGASHDRQLFFPSATNVAGGWVILTSAAGQIVVNENALTISAPAGSVSWRSGR